MPAIHERYPCHVCGKTHVLYFADGLVPDLDRQFFYTCTKPAFAVRITIAEGWKPADAKPPGALLVKCGDGAARAES